MKKRRLLSPPMMFAGTCIDHLRRPSSRSTFSCFLSSLLPHSICSSPARDRIQVAVVNDTAAVAKPDSSPNMLSWASNLSPRHAETLVIQCHHSRILLHHNGNASEQVFGPQCIIWPLNCSGRHRLKTMEDSGRVLP